MEESNMTEINEYKPGAFCWIDLSTTDTTAATKFYRELFGWDANDEPAGEGMVYTHLALGGKSVGGLYAMPKETRDMGVPPHWMSYISVENADQTAAKAKELGATVLMEPADVGEGGRMAVMQDPTGAWFSIWQPLKHHGAEIFNEPISLCWTELMTTDTKKAAAFYGGLFGYTAKVQNMGEIDYTSFMNGDIPTAGMMAITPGMGEGIPSHWAVYLTVEDCDATVSKAKSLGAQVYKDTSDIPGMGRFAVLADPQGAVFSVFESLTPPA